MTTVDELKAIADIDLKFNKIQLDVESFNVGLIHSRWLKMYVQETSVLRNMEVEQKKLYKTLWLHYSGKMEPAHYAKHPQPLKILRNDLSTFIEGDDMMVAVEKKLIDQRAVVEFLEKTVDRIKNRGFDIKNAIDFMKFTNGS